MLLLEQSHIGEMVQMDHSVTEVRVCSTRIDLHQSVSFNPMFARMVVQSKNSLQTSITMSQKLRCIHVCKHTVNCRHDREDRKPCARNPFPFRDTISWGSALDFIVARNIVTPIEVCSSARVGNATFWAHINALNLEICQFSG